MDCGIPKSRSSIVRLACVFAVLGMGAQEGAVAAPPAPLIAASNDNNQIGTNNNVIYSVGVTPQTALPPALSLTVMPNINPLAPAAATYAGFNSLVWVPSTQPGATEDLIASQTESG